MKSNNRRAPFLSMALALLLGVAAPLPGGINRWTSNGPQGQWISALASDPSRTATLYAGTAHGGIFKSANAGASWSALAPASTDLETVRSLVIAPGVLSTLYAGLDTEDPDRNHAGFVRSIDGGNHWSRSGLDFRKVSALAVDPASPSTVFAVAGSPSANGSEIHSEIQKSTDGGGSWRVLASMSWAIYSLVIDPRNPSTLYAGGDASDFDYPNLGSVIRTTDGGQTWVPVLESLCGHFSAVALDPIRTATVYVADNCDRLFKSTDAGNSWRVINLEFATGPFPHPGSFSGIVVDPRRPDSLYLGTDGAGVYRSIDGGETWIPFREGLADLGVQVLAIDATGMLLHAGTPSGVFDIEIAPIVDPCIPAPGRLCALDLLSGRFRVGVSAIDARTGSRIAGQAIAQGDEFGYFSLPQLTGDPTLPEVVVKMVDASSLSPGGGFWVFYSALTSLPYEMTATDTVTGQVRIYWSDGFCGGADTAAFPGDTRAGVGGTSSARTPLSASGGTLSLLGNRFQVTVAATNPRDGTTAPGAAIAQGDRFGYFSLPAFTGDPSFPEVFVKMIDATALPDGDFWLFHTGLTDMRYTLTVTDLVTGAVKTYHNDPSDLTRLCGGADTAFSRHP